MLSNCIAIIALYIYDLYELNWCGQIICHTVNDGKWFKKYFSDD